MDTKFRIIFWVIIIFILTPLLYYKSIKYKDNIQLHYTLLILSLLLIIIKSYNIVYSKQYEIDITTRLIWIIGILIGSYLLYMGIKVKDNFIIMFGSGMIIVKLFNLIGITTIT